MDEDIKKILGLSAKNGGKYWERSDGDIHAPAGFSTIDVLSTLGDLGVQYTDYALVQDAIGFIFSKYSKEDGTFQYHEKSSKLPCMAARIAAAFRKLGVEIDLLQKTYEYFLQTQCPDGGWRCNTVKRGKSPETDASNPGTTLYVLDAFMHRENNEETRKKMDKAVAFLLKHWDSKRPLGPCNFGIGSTFLKTEYPMLRYNILYYCHVLSHYPAALMDKRYKEAVAILQSKTADGQLINENPHRQWKEFPFAQRGKISSLATKIYHQICP